MVQRDGEAELPLRRVGDRVQVQVEDTARVVDLQRPEHCLRPLCGHAREHGNAMQKLSYVPPPSLTRPNGVGRTHEQQVTPPSLPTHCCRLWLWLGTGTLSTDDIDRSSHAQNVRSNRVALTQRAISTSPLVWCLILTRTHELVQNRHTDSLYLRSPQADSGTRCQTHTPKTAPCNCSSTRGCPTIFGGYLGMG